MQKLIERQKRLIKNISLDFKRSLYNNIDWSSRLIEIRGARGMGKTTIMLQRVKELSIQNINVLYVTLDDPYFFQNSLYDLTDKFYKYGGTHIFIDEVHRYPSKQKSLDWSVEIKNIYDAYPDLNIVYSGSSILAIYKGEGDLSRRKISYLLNGLSFREYLEFKKVISINHFELNEIISNHESIADDIVSKIKILPLFNEYLQSGFYPFFKETKHTDKFYERLQTVVNLIIENDIPSVAEIKYESIAKLKKLLALITTSPPYTSDMKSLANQLYISDYKTLLKLLDFLDKSELLILLHSKAKENKIMHKPEKIYINNTNLLYALNISDISKGTVRETFFINQLKYLHNIKYPKTCDFLVDDKFLFEIGGKNKTKKQIKKQTNAFIVTDDIETGFMNKIPLYLFGFLY